MRLSAELQDAIQRETDKVDRRKLAQATAQLTERYKAADFSTPAVATEAHRAAYLGGAVARDVRSYLPRIC